jgi:hypothetical protein
LNSRVRKRLALALVLILASACATPRAPEPVAPVATLAPARTERAAPASRAVRHHLPPAVLALLLAQDEAPAPVEITLRERELAPPARGSRAVGTFIPADQARYIFIGRYQWLRADLWSALKWCLAKFYWDVSSTSDADRRLVLQDACGLAPGVPEHPAPTHGNALRWLDVCYPTTGPSNCTQAASGDPGLPLTAIWDGDRPARLDCRRLYLWWELLARVFPAIGIETDSRILAAVTSWAAGAGIAPARLATVLGRVYGDDPATSMRRGHPGHMHLDFGDEVAWGALRN